LGLGDKMDLIEKDLSALRELSEDIAEKLQRLTDVADGDERYAFRVATGQALTLADEIAALENWAKRRENSTSVAPISLSAESMEKHFP
jgi:hypothetical protein